MVGCGSLEEGERGGSREASRRGRLTAKEAVLFCRFVAHRLRLLGSRVWSPRPEPEPKRDGAQAPGQVSTGGA